MTWAFEASTALRYFFATLPFVPDPFQRQGATVVASDKSLIVTAPTGAGKTVIAEAGIYLSLSGGRRAFYTTPIKALSNQKFDDFRTKYGDTSVGLLTGDNVINANAPLVVMTTEVLRNMIYANPERLDEIGIVILDEVHYLQDLTRGAVWEEIIIHLPKQIPLVALSATIANAEEFTAWVEERRGPTQLITEDNRPVPLENMYLLKDRNRDQLLELLPTFKEGRKDYPNPELIQLLKKGKGRGRRFSMPRRLETIERLISEDLIPVIYFIFSRAGCDQAAIAVGSAALGLTDPAERLQIRNIASEHAEGLSDGDLRVLNFDAFVGNLEAGVGTHHAGMIPAFKETVEQLFSAGLLKVVFATETLALGINMPARAVVIERLSKFTGEKHELLQPGDYTQLTGRAGRRGIDRRGTAIVLHDYNVPFSRVASIAAAGCHPLRSSFRPTYNMVVNLVGTYPQERAMELLGASFAQFEMRNRQGQLEDLAADSESDLRSFRESARCDQGDIWSFVSNMRSPESASRSLRDFVKATNEGDILTLGGRGRRRWVILARGRGISPRLLLLSSDGEVRKLTPDQLSLSVARIGSMALPAPIKSRDIGYQQTVTEELRTLKVTDRDLFRPNFLGMRSPLESCPSLSNHLEWVRRVSQEERKLGELRRKIAASNDNFLAIFRSMLELLEDWGFMVEWSLTGRGRQLRFLYSDLDLLLVEALNRDMLHSLDGAELAALISMFSYQPRPSDITGDWPTAVIADRGIALIHLGRKLKMAERRYGLRESPLPEPGFAETAYAWASGSALDEVFSGDPSVGDFVRNCRQLLDLLRQVRDSYSQMRVVAQQAIDSLDRGVVASGGRA